MELGMIFILGGRAITEWYLKRRNSNNDKKINTLLNGMYVGRHSTENNVGSRIHYWAKGRERDLFVRSST